MFPENRKNRVEIPDYVVLGSRITLLHLVQEYSHLKPHAVFCVWTPCLVIRNPVEQVVKGGLLLRHVPQRLYPCHEILALARRPGTQPDEPAQVPFEVVYENALYLVVKVVPCGKFCGTKLPCFFVEDEPSENATIGTRPRTL